MRRCPMQGLPIILSGRDMIGVAFTGSGKTLVFALPMLMMALQEEVRLPLVRGARLAPPAQHAPAGTPFAGGMLLGSTQPARCLPQHAMACHARVLHRDARLTRQAVNGCRPATLGDLGLHQELTSFAGTAGEGPVGLIVCPSRELARQTHEVIMGYIQSLKQDGFPELRALLAMGGIDMREQVCAHCAGSLLCEEDDHTPPPLGVCMRAFREIAAQRLELLHSASTTSTSCWMPCI